MKRGKKMFVEAFKIAIKSLMSNKLRSFLSILGIVIGVFAVIVVISIGEGTSYNIKEKIMSLGTNLILVTPGKIGGRAGTRYTAISDLFTEKDGEKILNSSDAIINVSPIIQRSLLVEYRTNNMDSLVAGVYANYEDILNVRLDEGRFLIPSDEDYRRRVAVIGSEVSDTLFPYEDPLGRTITIYTGKTRQHFKVIGVMAPKGRSLFQNLDNMIIVPFSTAQARLFHTKYVPIFAVQASSSKDTDRAIEAIDRVMYAKYKDEEKYNITSQKELLSTISETSRILTMMLAGIASVALLVGGIGIMNIMLVSVAERTREIGVRKAIGARKIDIIMQFLLESVVLTSLGGILGVIIGIVGSKVMSYIAGWTTVITPWSVIVAFSFSILIGLFFGIYPARKAASLDPIEALRYE